MNASGSQIAAPGVGVTRSILLPALTRTDKIGIFRNGLWQLDFNEKEMFFIFRSYMEPATLVSPDDNELLYDRAIYFGPYFAGQ